METELDSLEQPTQMSGGQCTNMACKSDWNIAISIDVNADARRICQALTVPEYLEAWICTPDQPAASQIVASQEPNGYRLDLYEAGRVAISFSGSLFDSAQAKSAIVLANDPQANVLRKPG